MRRLAARIGYFLEKMCESGGQRSSMKYPEDSKDYRIYSKSTSTKADFRL